MQWRVLAAMVCGVALASWSCAALADDSCTPSATDTAACGVTTNLTTPSDPLDQLHLFGNNRHLQATADQVSLAVQPGPLPLAISGNVQRWTSGPPLLNLYTESAQGFYRINDNWKIVAQQLYQQQGSITLDNFVTGFNYRPNDDLSINVTAGLGDHTNFTYQWSTYVSPQYRLPWEIAGKQRISVEADLTFEKYILGTFSQVIPKINIDIAPWLPQLAIGYAFGGFNNSTGVSATRYYQPQTVRGVILGAVARPLENAYVVVSYLPANRNYIAGGYATQSTVAGTVHWNLTDKLRLSVYGEDTWYSGGADLALGGGFSMAF